MANPLNRTTAALIAGKNTAATLIAATTYPEAEGEIAWATDTDQLFIGTDPATGGSFYMLINRHTVAIKSGDYTLTRLDSIVTFTATATATLPAATGSGTTYRIICRSGLLTIDGNGSDTVKGELTQILTAGEDLIISDTATGVWE